MEDGRQRLVMHAGFVLRTEIGMWNFSKNKIMMWKDNSYLPDVVTRPLQVKKNQLHP
jgi:uncharacterized protein YfaT (DUF1175 family)